MTDVTENFTGNQRLSTPKNEVELTASDCRINAEPDHSADNCPQEQFVARISSCRQASVGEASFGRGRHAKRTVRGSCSPAFFGRRQVASPRGNSL